MKRKIGPLFSLNEKIHVSIYQSFKKNNLTKPCRASEILGCSIEFFKEYLESKFEPWMNRDNHGIYIKGEINKGWEIDHILPISRAKTEKDLLKLNH